MEPTTSAPYMIPGWDTGESDHSTTPQTRLGGTGAPSSHHMLSNKRKTRTGSLFDVDPDWTPTPKKKSKKTPTGKNPKQNTQTPRPVQGKRSAQGLSDLEKHQSNNNANWPPLYHDQTPNAIQQVKGKRKESAKEWGMFHREVTWCTHIFRHKRFDSGHSREIDRIPQKRGNTKDFYQREARNAVRLIVIRRRRQQEDGFQNQQACPLHDLR